MGSTRNSLLTITALMLIASTLLTEPACGYQQSTTTGRIGSGIPVRWASPIVRFEINGNGTVQLGDKAATVAAIRRAMETWNTVNCSSFRFEDAGVSNRQAGIDFKNVIVFRDKWWPYDPSRLAQTTVTVDKETGEIVDADIQLNAVHFQWSLGDADVLADVQAVVTHELGHALGLDHACDDQEGCPQSPALLSATMYHLIPAGETDKRSLDSDDIDGVCAIYPASMELEPQLSRLKLAQQEGGCQLTPVSSGSRHGAWPFLAMAMAMAWLWLRRRRESFLA